MNQELGNSAVVEWSNPRQPVGGDEAWDESSASLQQYLGIVLKRRKLILGIILLAILAAFVFTMLSERIYVARTTFEVQRKAPQVLDASTPETDAATNDAQFMKTQFAYVSSRAMAAGIVRRLNLDKNDAFVGDVKPLPNANGGSDAARTQQRRVDVAISKVQANITAAPYNDSAVIELRFQYNDPRLAAAVANAAVDEFIESAIQRQFAASSYVRSFVGSRLNELKGKLEASERDLVQYAEVNRIIPASDARGGGGSQSLDSAALSALSDRLAQARAARLLAEESWTLARSPQGRSMPQIRENAQYAALATQLTGLMVDYQQKLQTYRPTFNTMVTLRGQIASVRSQMDRVAAQATEGLHASFTLAQKQENAIQAQVDQLKDSVLNLQNRNIQYTILQREVDTNRALYDALLQRYKEIGVAGGSGANNVSIIDRARAPGAPSSPNLWLNLVLALGAGLALGLGLAFVLEFLDDTIKSVEDVERKLHLPLLGLTPLIKSLESVDDELANRRSSLSESYYSIRTALQLADARGLPKSLLITSAAMGEGKSTTAVGLATSFIDGNKRVLLIDADLRRPTLHRRFGQPNKLGLSNVLTGEIPYSQALVRIEALGLDVITSGPLSPNPAQLLAGGMKERLAEFTNAYDLVIVDGPPVLGLADAALLSDSVESTLLVVEAGKSRRGAVRNALRRLTGRHSNLVGCVLTKFSSRVAGYGYSYDYATYYYSYGRDGTAKP